MAFHLVVDLLLVTEIEARLDEHMRYTVSIQSHNLLIRPTPKLARIHINKSQKEGFLKRKLCNSLSLPLVDIVCFSSLRIVVSLIVLKHDY